MADGAQVGRAYIEVTPRLNLKGLQGDLKRQLGGVAKEIDQAYGKIGKDPWDKFRKGMREFQKEGRQGPFADLNKEMVAHQKLIRQLETEAKRQVSERTKRFELETRQIADSIRAQKALADQKTKALSEVQKAERQAYAEADKRNKAEQAAVQRKIAELTKWGQQKHAIEKADAAESLRIAKQAQEDMDKAFKYRTMRAMGATPEQAAATATGKTVRPGELGTQLTRLSAQAKRTGGEVAKAMDTAAHSMSQLSTRIGLASFQMQLLGGFATTFLTGPAAMAFGGLARDGLKFATSIGYARASMESLLGPSENVEKILADIRKMAIESPLFNTEDAISYAQKLAAVGVKGKDLYKSMQALSNIFLTQGVAGPERANLALMAYTQILSKGTIGMDDLRQQFAEHVPGGIKVFEQAAKVLGFKTLDDLRKSMKDGKTSAAELNEAFIKLGNSDKYLDGATRSAQTLGGVWQAFNEDIQSTVGMAFDANRKEIIAAIEGIKPVVMELIGAFVKALPTLIDWLGRLVAKAQQIKRAYDDLSPAQQDIVRQIILITLASGPAAIAIGIFGTALSGIANVAALAMKGLSLFGTTLVPLGGWLSVVVVGLGILATALGILYTKSEPVRKSMLQLFNQVKDAIANAFLPVLDLLIGSVQSLEKTFSFLGLETKDLAWILGILILPLITAMQMMLTITVAIKALQLVMLALGSVAYAVTQILSGLIWVLQQLFQGLSHLPGVGNYFEGVAESAERAQKKLSGLVDVTSMWKGLTEGNSNATDKWQDKLNALDLTTTGLTGAFGTWNGMVDQSIQKQLTLEEAINNARNAMQGQASTARSLTDASDAFKQSQIGLTESVKANGRTLNEHTRAGQNNRTALKQAASASYEMMLQDIRSGVPMNEAIKRHKERTKALKDEFGKNKETKAAADKLIESYGKVPKDVKTLLKLMGYTDVAAKMQEILAAQKVAARPGLSYSSALQAERKAWQMEKRDGLKGDGFATGGLIRGPGGPTGDKIPIMASNLEYMIRSRSAQKLGKPVLDYINRTGELPVQQFAQGGSVSWPMNVDVSKTKFPELLGGPATGGGIGVAAMMAILRRQFPGLPLISGYRPGAVTSTGNRSYHALGRAVDLPPSWDVFNWISQNYGRATKELIFTPAGGRQIKNGQNHVFTGGTIQQDHYDHVHWAYDNGGQIAPNQPFINKTGANELALNAAQGKALENKIENSDRPITVAVYVDGVRRDAEIVFEEKTEELIQALGGV